MELPLELLQEWRYKRLNIGRQAGRMDNKELKECGKEVMMLVALNSHNN